LPEVEPIVEAPSGGGNERAQVPSDTTISFTLKYPEDINIPLDGAVSLFPADYINNPTFSIPSVFLNARFPIGVVSPGETVQLNNIPISFFVLYGDPVTFPSTWTLQISIYVEGGTRPTPTAGVDHQVLVPFTFTGKNDPVVVPGELLLVPSSCFFNCD
jgi:hypothetical protein